MPSRANEKGKQGLWGLCLFSGKNKSLNMVAAPARLLMITNLHLPITIKRDTRGTGLVSQYLLLILELYALPLTWDNKSTWSSVSILVTAAAVP